MKMFRKIVKAFSDVLFVLVIVAFVIVTVVAVLSNINMRQNKLLFGSFGFGHVLTGSMEPDIPTGSFVLIRDAHADTLCVGDVIMFRSKDPSVPENLPVCHQIVRIEQEGGERLFFTKGTANEIEDTYPVDAESIIGIVTYHSEWIGKVIGLSQSAYVYPVLILLLAVSMIQSAIEVIRQLISYQKQNSE